MDTSPRLISLPNGTTVLLDFNSHSVSFPSTPGKKLSSVNEIIFLQEVEEFLVLKKEGSLEEFVSQRLSLLSSSSSSLVPYSEVFPNNLLLKELQKRKLGKLYFLPSEIEILSNSLLQPSLIYDEDKPKIPYRRHPEETRGVIHWGQRKLFLAEVFFLSECLASGFEGKKVIYIGAADGQHIPFLSKLFPFLEFDLWDPAPFAPSVVEYGKKTGKIILHNDLFTSSDAKRLRSINEGNDILFISDIRSREISSEEDQTAFFEGKENDMQLQIDSIRTLTPWAASLKFSPLYDNGETIFPSGRIVYQAWAPKSSTETRLWCFKDENPGYQDEMKIFNRPYEQVFYFQNNVFRYTEIPTGSFPGANVLIVENTYDLWHEVEVWNMYLNNYLVTGSSVLTEEEKTNLTKDRKKIVGKLIQRLSQELGKEFLQQFIQKIERKRTKK